MRPNLPEPAHGDIQKCTWQKDFEELDAAIAILFLYGFINRITVCMGNRRHPQAIQYMS